MIGGGIREKSLVLRQEKHELFLGREQALNVGLLFQAVFLDPVGPPDIDRRDAALDPRIGLGRAARVDLDRGHGQVPQDVDERFDQTGVGRTGELGRLLRFVELERNRGPRFPGNGFARISDGGARLEEFLLVRRPQVDGEERFLRDSVTDLAAADHTYVDDRPPFGRRVGHRNFAYPLDGFSHG